MKELRFGALCLAITVLVGLSGCAGKQVSRCNAPGDTPERHFFSGMAALDRGETATARAELERAVYCDAGSSPAYDGLAIVHAQDSALSRDPESKKAEKEKALAFLDEARRHSRTGEDAFDHYLASIRVYPVVDIQGWQFKTEEFYGQAGRTRVNEKRLVYYEGVESLQYFMGMAYLKAGEFQKAREMFARVLDARPNGKWREPADRAWKRADKVSRALAGAFDGSAGKKVALQGFVTRAQLSALLAEGVKIDLPSSGPGVTPLDIAQSPFKADILTFLKWKTRGIELKYDPASKAYLFAPDDLVKRGEMAFILEDLLLKMTKDESLARRYLGQEKSPFADVTPTSPFYNAVMTVTSRGLMEADLSGTFKVDGPLDGADAILAIRMLCQVAKGS